MGMPPGGEAMDPQMLEISRAVMPDYPRWRTAFFRIDIICAGITFLLGIIFFFYYRSHGMIDGEELRFFLTHLLIPTLLHLLILGVAARLRKKLPDMDMRQNIIPIFALLLINLVVCLTHKVFVVALAIFCVPICMTTVFTNKKLCQLVTNISIGAVVISVIKEYLTATEMSDRIFLIPQGVLIICILIVMGAVAQIALNMTNGQKQKLFDYALSVKEEQRRAEAANIAKSAFLANMSHEIRTPINAILGMNEMILRENQNEQIAEYARSVHIAGNSLLGLVNDVLDISKIESGKLEIIEDNYGTSSFIHDCYNMIAEKAVNKGLDLQVECSDKLPSQLHGDEIRLRQVITNLLSNAVKYTEKGSVTLSVNGEREDDKFTLILEVRDTGIGIKPENLEKLFSQFTRFDLEKNRNIEGTGLGLAISHQLVDLMQGEISVHSIYGVGSSFTVKVPQQIVDDTPMGDYHAKYKDERLDNINNRQILQAPDARILVVDDVEVNLKVIVNLLKETCVRVDTAKNGLDCLDLVSMTKYDLIFLDHMMPEMDGIETFQRMKQMKDSPNANTPVIMLTANAISGVRDKYLQTGFADYVSKPVSGERLEAVLQKYLPEELIQRGGLPPQLRAATEAEKAKEADTPLQKLKNAYPKIDLDYGMETCGGDQDVYVDILQTFAEEAKIEEIRAFYDAKDTLNYQTLVHGVKSASLSMGLKDLSAMALALEKAAKESDWGYIEENHPAFDAEYRKALDAIGSAISR